MLLWKNELVKNKLKGLLSATFYMKEMGEAKNFVGLHITHNEKEICLDQTIYTK